MYSLHELMIDASATDQMAILVVDDGGDDAAATDRRTSGSGESEMQTTGRMFNMKGQFVVCRPGDDEPIKQGGARWWLMRRTGKLASASRRIKFISLVGGIQMKR